MLEKTPTVCPACSRGCSVTLEWLPPQFADAARCEIKRVVPRRDPKVNGYWMCDIGRRCHKHVGDSRRLSQATVEGKAVAIEKACEIAGARLAGIARERPRSVAGIASAWMTVEEMWLFSRLISEGLGGRIRGMLSAPRAEDAIFPGFRISGDRNPNRAGAAIVLGADADDGRLEEVAEAIRKGEILAAYVACGIPGFEPPADLIEALGGLRFLVVQDVLPSELSRRAHVVLPGASFAEKEGVFVCDGGLARKISRAFDPPAGAADDVSILQMVLRAVTAGAWESASAARIFELAAREHGEFEGMTHEKLAGAGMPIRKTP
jgi:NADH-quinone oxidoreductase subunit G